jgi:ribonuclease Z
MTSSIRILTTSGLDSNPSLLLVSPNGSKTLINCGEGCQRAFLESSSLGPNINVGSLRVSSVNRVCLTHTSHDALGGLPGMILTTADVAESAAKNFQQSQANGGKINGQQQRQKSLKRNGSLVSDEGNEGMPDLEIVGPIGTKSFLHSLRHFMRRDRFNIHVHEGDFDSSICSNGNESSANQVPKKKAKKNKTNPSSNDDIGFTVRSIPIDYTFDVHNESFTKQAVSYIFTTPPIPGKFLIEKANELKIPRGPMYSQLKSGKSVTFTDPVTNEERTVTPEQVLAEGSGGIFVAVLYCPKLDVMNGIQQLDLIKSLNPDTTTTVELDAVVHLTPKAVFETNEYQAWCMSFGPRTEHIILHVAETLEDRISDGTNSPFVSAMRGAVRRSLVNNELFPKPKLEFVGETEIGQNENGKDIGTIKTIAGCPMMEYVLLPRSRQGVNELTTKPIYTEDDFISLKKHVSESGAIDLGKEITAAETTGTKLDSSDTNENGGDNGELIFTGTGSAVPCKHRNVTGMYLRMQNGNGMLLDVGEGTVGQLLQSWRSTLSPTTTLIDEYRRQIKGIKAVWISHPHADHHLGLLRLLSEKSLLGARENPIVIMAPPNMFAFLSEYQNVAPEIKQTYIAVDAREMKDGLSTDHIVARRLFDQLGLTSCASVPVAHCPNSFAIILDGTSFGRIAYSGDCRPSNRFAAAARGADVLIHEATFEDGMEEEAVLKRHSTVGEAMDIATAMQAKSLVLTHFSQRYPKIPRLSPKGRNDQPIKAIPIVIAFDFMRLRKDSVLLASKLTPALRLLYPDGDRDGEIEGDDANNAEARDLMSVPGVFAAKGIL